MITAIFSDFDGTISRRDVGYSIFHHFSDGKNDELLPDWKSGKMSTRDCLLKEAELVSSPASEIEKYIDQFEIDRYFEPFVNQCAAHDFPLTIISDGLDFYIRYILEKNGLDHLDFIANRGILENNTIKIEFPYENKSCGRCGICKGEQIRNFRADQDGESRIIFIGDGYSDVCAAAEADILFAKKDLKEYCTNKNLTFIDYDNFQDVTDRLVELGIMKK